MIAIEQRKEIDLNLRQHEVINISHPQPGLSIECEQGVLWITIAGDINDHTLLSGESYVVQDTHLVVIEAMEEDAIVKLRDISEEFAAQAVF
jgi:hypothetical protein